MPHVLDKWFRRFALVLGVAGAAFLLYSVRSLVGILIVAGLIAYVLDPPVRHLERRGVGRGVASMLVFFGLVLVIVLGTVFLVPHVIAQVNELRAGLSLAESRAILDNLERSIRTNFGFFIEGPVDLTERLRTASRWVGDRLLESLPGLFSALTQLVLIPFIALGLLRDGRKVKKGLVRLVPNRYFEFTLSVLSRTNRQIGNYLTGQLTAAAIVAGLSIAVLWMLEVPYFVLIGLFAGAANVVPYLGPIVGASIASVVAILDTGHLLPGGYVVGAFVAIQMLDESLIQPLTVARSINLHPLIVLLSVVAGGKLFGFLGMLLAAPAAAISKVIVEESLKTARGFRFH